MAGRGIKIDGDIEMATEHFGQNKMGNCIK